jgi:hypothetical protein
MKNVTLAVEGNILTIIADLSVTVGPSNSGKTLLVATTEGIVTVPGRDERIGLNIFRYPQAPSS